MKKTKLVYEDAGRDKAIVGIVTDDGNFLKLIDDYGNVIRVRKDRVVLRKDGNY